MNTDEAAREINEALEQIAATSRQTGACAWELWLGNGRARKASVRLKGEWLFVDSATGRRTGRKPSALLAAHRHLRGLGRSVTAGRESAVRLRAEIPIGHDVHLPEMLQETCAGLVDFHTLLPWVRLGSPGKKPECSSIQRRDGGKGGEPEREREAALREQIEQTGWTVHERPDGRLLVDLEAPPGSFQARIHSHPEGCVRTAVELGRFVKPEPSVREAVTLLLLAASESVRFARPVLEESDETMTVSYEVRLPRSPSTREIDLAVTALSVAAQVCGKEVPELAKSPIASAYLRSRGWIRGKGAHR